MTPGEQQAFLQAERDVEQHSAELKKELRLPDLISTQILYIVGLYWIGTAAKLGSSHVMFWLPAVIFFYIPSGIVVVHLSREMPLEGGIYQWAKLRFGLAAGFLLSLNFWFYTTILLSEVPILIANNLAYSVGPAGSWMAESKWVIAGLAVAIAACLIAVAQRGLVLGKWIHNSGGIVLVLLFVLAAALAIPRWISGGAAVKPIAFTPPPANLFNLNILG
jgi:amino acid transporter